MKKPTPIDNCFVIDKQCQDFPPEANREAPQKRVLLVSYYFPPCIHGYAIRIYNFMRFLPCFGWKPHVLTIDPLYYKEKKGVPSTFDDTATILRTGSLEPKRSLFQTFYQDKNNLKQISEKTPTAKSLSFQSKYSRNHLLIPDNQILWLPYAVAAGQRLIRKEKIDLIYVTSPPFSPLLVGYLLKKATGKPLLFEYRDSWQDNLDHRHDLSPTRRKIEEYLERVVIRNANQVVLVTEGMRKNMVSRFPYEPEDKFQVIPNGFDPDLCSYLQTQEANEEKYFTITYSGSMEYDRDPRQFLLAMKEFFADHPEAASQTRINLIGNTEQEFVDFVQQEGLSSNVHFPGYLPYDENIKYLAGSDLLFLIANDLRPDSIPGKLYEYLLLNKPILALVGNNVSGSFLEDFPRARIIKPQDQAGMKDFVWESFQRYQKTGHQDWKLDRNTLRYCRKNQTGRLAELFNSQAKQ